jgi:hypothetical protein
LPVVNAYFAIDRDLLIALMQSGNCQRDLIDVGPKAKPSSTAKYGYDLRRFSLAAKSTATNRKRQAVMMTSLLLRNIRRGHRQHLQRLLDVRKEIATI